MIFENRGVLVSKLKIFLMVICICFIIVSCKNSEISYIKEKLGSVHETVYVYITDTGSKFHSEMCMSLKYSKIKCTLEQAEEKGLTECKICKPLNYK